jgi:hypothetical protein
MIAGKLTQDIAFPPPPKEAEFTVSPYYTYAVPGYAQPPAVEGENG